MSAWRTIVILLCYSVAFITPVREGGVGCGVECHNGYKAECGINNIKSILYYTLDNNIWLGRCMHVGSLYKYHS